MAQKHGEVQYSDTEYTKNDNRPNNKDTFLKLNPGSNVVRLVTLPYQYYQHKYKFDASEKGFGHRIYCSAAHGSCPVCAKGDKPKRRWLLGVIDRKTNSYRILDISWSVLKSLQTLNRDEDWGDPQNYDVDIVVDPNGGPVGFYSVVAKPKKNLTAQDLVLRDQANLEDLVRRTSAPPPERVEERFQKLMEDFISTSGAGAALSKNKAVQSPSDDDDLDFADADANAAPF